MTTSEKIKTAFERNEHALIRQPGLGYKTGKVKVSSAHGLSCEIDSGSWKFKCDMGEKLGGNETGPSPSAYEAGALGSCIAIMAKLWAAKLGVPINHIEIEVEYDTDMSLLFGVNGAPSHWTAIRYQANVESDAPEEDIRQVLNLAHNHSHVRGDLEYAFHIERKVKIVKKKRGTDYADK